MRSARDDDQHQREASSHARDANTVPHVATGGRVTRDGLAIHPGVKNHKTTTKLALSTHTLRALTAVELQQLAGGISSESNYNTCRGVCGGTVVYGCGQSKAFTGC